MKDKKQSGQATLEFILSFTLSISFFVFFVYYGVNYTVGYLAHYATFMGSRTFLTVDSGERTESNFETEQATKVFDDINLLRFGASYEGGLRFNVPERGKPYEFVGAYLLFNPPFDLDFDDSGNLLSESFLGKEPKMGQCECQILKAMGYQGGGDCGGSPNLSQDVTLYDNGC